MAARDATIVLVCSIDPVLRDATVGVLVRRLPGAVGVVDGCGAYTLGTRTPSVDCPLCALREDVLHAVSELTEGAARPRAIVVGLPAGADPESLLAGPSPDGARFGPVLMAIDGSALEWVLSEDALLADWATELADEGHQPGQVVTDLLRSCDLLVTPAPLSMRSRVLVEEAAGPMPYCRIVDLRPGKLAGLGQLAVERAGTRSDVARRGCGHQDSCG